VLVVPARSRAGGPDSAGRLWSDHRGVSRCIRRPHDWRPVGVYRVMRASSRSQPSSTTTANADNRKHPREVCVQSGTRSSMDGGRAASRLLRTQVRSNVLLVPSLAASDVQAEKPRTELETSGVRHAYR
jgi:hypothetical protein